MTRSRKESGATANLAQALEGFLKESGLHTAMKHPELSEIWERMAGPEIAAHAQVIGFKSGRLEIGVDSSSLMTDIQFHKTAILKDLRREIKTPFISGITFVLKANKDDDEQ